MFEFSLTWLSLKSDNFSVHFLNMRGSSGGGGGGGARDQDPRCVDFLIINYRASIQCGAIIGPPWKRHFAI